MNTKQHNLNPVERTLCASGLLGRPGQRHQTDRGYLDSSQVLAWEPAAMLGLSGLSAGIPGFGQIKTIA
jgi:hypothetical protein